MSLMKTVMAGIVQIMPDREHDELRDAHRVIGKSVDRVDGRVKVTGKAPFTAEYELDGLVHAALVYSTVANGKIKSIEASAAEQAPGVLAVITHLNAPKMKAPPLFNPSGGSGAAGSKLNVLNTDEVLYDGQPIAVVVAQTLEQAEAAAALVKAEIEPSAAKVSFLAAKAQPEKPANIMGEEREVKHGDPDKAFADAPVQVDLEFDTPRYNHNPIELHATTATWQGPDRVLVYDATQFIRGNADTLAEIFSLKPEDVRVVSPYVGGGFGSKGSVWPHVQLTVLAAKVVQRPVRTVLSREGVFRVVGGRTPSSQRVRLGSTPEGHFTALMHTGVTATSMTNDYAEQFTFPARFMYGSDTYLVDQDYVHLNTTANTFMRAPGESIGTFALESAIDELSWKLNMDPIELRLQNEPEKQPAKKLPFSSRHLPEAFRRGAEKFGWAQRPKQVRAKREGEWLIGTGVAAAFYPAYRYPAAARVHINADGSAVIQTSGQEMGMGTATVQSQAAAERLGLTMDKVRFEYGDSTLPQAPVAGGSNQTVSLALAVKEASDKLLKDILKLVRGDERSPLSTAQLEDVEARNNGLFLRDKPNSGETYAQILQRAGKASMDAEATSGKPLEAMKWAMGSFGAQFCEVRVNEITGELRISRWLGVFDTGRILNPKTATSQFRGGIIMGIGMAMLEETYFDDRFGRIMNPSLAEYHVPVNLDIPYIDVEFLDIPDPETPLGAHGIGEIGITGAAAAIANAVYHATGKRIRTLPITLDKLM